MSTWDPKTLELNGGVDTYSPAIAGEELKFLTLNNIEPRLGRLFASKGSSLFQVVDSGTERIVSFAMYHLSNRQGTNIYALSSTKAYWFNIATGLFENTAIYSGFLNTNDPYVVLPWYDCVYVTKPGQPLVRLQHKTATVISNSAWGRYGVVANGHLYLGCAGDSISNQLARVRWSDLDDPESWAIDTNASEADFFDLEPEERQITGISYQRGRPLVYSEDSIWTGQYIGFPGGFRHEPLFPGLGNIFHGSVVRTKEVDYFIGKDNFYALNGLQPVPIGDEIFPRFIDDVVITSDTVVKGYFNPRKHQVFWVYDSVAHTGSGLWAVVFNYKENKWSERRAEGLLSFFDPPRTKVRGYTVINDNATVINSASGLIDALENILTTVPQLACVPYSSVFHVVTPEGSFKPYNDTLQECALETFDFYVDDFTKVKEVTKLVFEAVRTSTLPSTLLYVGTRKNQSDAITWSSSISTDSLDSNLAFFIRSEGVGRYIRFRLYFNNVAANYISQLLLLSITKVEENVDANATK